MTLCVRASEEARKRDADAIDRCFRLLRSPTATQAEFDRAFDAMMSRIEKIGRMG
jgi:hypothetical protein